MRSSGGSRCRLPRRRPFPPLGRLGADGAAERALSVDIRTQSFFADTGNGLDRWAVFARDAIAVSEPFFDVLLSDVGVVWLQQPRKGGLPSGFFNNGLDDCFACLLVHARY